MSDTGEALREIGELLDKQFPDFVCLRCGNDKFMVIANPIPAAAGQTVPRLARRAALLFDRVAFSGGRPFDDPEDFAKMVCRRCGFAEDHYLPAIAATSLAKDAERE